MTTSFSELVYFYIKHSDSVHYYLVICFSWDKKYSDCYPVPHSRNRLVVADPKPPIHSLHFAIHKNCKTTCPKVENEILNIVHVQCILHLLKARTTMDIFLSYSYILVFLPKSLFSITLINTNLHNTVSHHKFVRKSNVLQYTVCTVLHILYLSFERWVIFAPKPQKDVS